MSRFYSQKRRKGGNAYLFTGLFVKYINSFQTCHFQIYEKLSFTTKNKKNQQIKQLIKILAMCGFIFCMLLFNHMFVLKLVYEKLFAEI